MIFVSLNSMLSPRNLHSQALETPTFHLPPSEGAGRAGCNTSWFSFCDHHFQSDNTQDHSLRITQDHFVITIFNRTTRRIFGGVFWKKATIGETSMMICTRFIITVIILIMMVIIIQTTINLVNMKSSQKVKY